MPDFDRLIQKHKDAVYRQLLRMCGNAPDADDVLGEAMVNAFRAMESLQSPDQFQAWLVQIGRRVCGRLKKREALKPYMFIDDLDSISGLTTEAETNVSENELRRCLYAALDGLPTHYREVYELRDLQGRSADETAQALGITVANVKSRLHRARHLVREYVDKGLAGLVSCSPN